MSDSSLAADWSVSSDRVCLEIRRSLIPANNLLVVLSFKLAVWFYLFGVFYRKSCFVQQLSNFFAAVAFCFIPDLRSDLSNFVSGGERSNADQSFSVGLSIWNSLCPRVDNSPMLKPLVISNSSSQ